MGEGFAEVTDQTRDHLLFRLVEFGFPWLPLVLFPPASIGPWKAGIG